MSSEFPPATWDAAAIEKTLPHRYENIVLDHCHGDGSGAGTFSLDIGNDDARNIFSLNLDEQRYLIPSISIEVIALAAICCMSLRFPNPKAFFAGISNFQSSGYLDLSQPLKGELEPGQVKRSFYKFKGKLTDHRGNEASAQLTAFFSDQYLEIPSVDPGAAPENLSLVPEPSYKSPDMFLIDGLISTSDSEISASYQYPTEHPLCKGHFPGNPLMMGVMQWMMIEDLAYAFALSNGICGNETLVGSAIITRSDGAVVSQIQDARIEITADTSGIHSVRMTECQRVLFKDVLGAGHRVQLDAQFTPA